MPRITFKAKPETVYNIDGTPAYDRIKVPAIKRRHCDMAAFRAHPRFGSYANSDLFANLLARQLREAGIGAYIRMNKMPACVNVDASGFLASVTINID